MAMQAVKNYFIYSAIFGLDQSCPRDPDRAGKFVVGAQLVAVTSTWLALIGTMVCDSSIDHPDPDGINIPLPRWLKLQEHCTKKLRPKLARFILFSADAQFCSGLAFLVSTFVIAKNSGDVDDSLSSPLTTLAVYYLCMISSVHQAELLVMRTEITRHRRATMIRMLLLICFVVMLVVLVDWNFFAFEPLFIPLERMLKSGMTHDSLRKLEYVIPPIIMMWIYSTAIFQLFSSSIRETRAISDWWLFTTSRNRFRVVRIGKKLIQWLLFSNVKIVFGVQMLSAVISTVFMGLQKYTSAPPLTEADKNQYPGIVAWCDLVDRYENPWTVGQLTTMILAFAPFYSFTTDMS